MGVAPVSVLPTPLVSFLSNKSEKKLLKKRSMSFSPIRIRSLLQFRSSRIRIHHRFSFLSFRQKIVCNLSVLRPVGILFLAQTEEMENLSYPLIELFSD